MLERSRRFLVGLAAFGLSTPSLVLGQSLLQQVREGNQANLQSIHSLHCKVKITVDPVDFAPSYSGEYWRSMDRVRCKASGPKGTYDTILEGTVLRSHHHTKSGSRTNLGGTVRRYESKMIGECDVWVLASIVVSSAEPAAFASLDELLNKPHRLNLVERRNLDGRDCIYVSVEHALSKQELWLDPALNYLVKKHVLAYPSVPDPRTASGKTEVTLHDLKEFAPGIYFPQAVESRHFMDDQLRYTRRMVFSDMRINKPLDSTAFDFRFPPGITIQDSIENKQYKVDAAGKKTGPETDLSTAQPLPGGGPQVTPRTETREDPKSWTRWILPVSIAMLILALLIRYRQRWRRDAAP